MRASKGGRHISGAEGLFAPSDVDRAVKEYVERAASHPRGAPDFIKVTVERLREKPREIKALPVTTLNCKSPSEAKKHAVALLRSLGVSDAAIRTAFRVLGSRNSMRGAALVAARSGRRLEPDEERGVRASMMGIDRKALKALSAGLARAGINTDTVKEALVLASKVASAGGVVAELCASDDPDYTTGYVASRCRGYVRLPNIKKKGSLAGGRVFFIKDGADLPALIEYLERRPAIVREISTLRGVLTAPELLPS